MSWACFFLLTTQVNINFGRSKSKTVIFTKIIFAIELEFAKSAKFTARENFALYGMCQGVKFKQQLCIFIIFNVILMFIDCLATKLVRMCVCIVGMGQMF